ncbi:MAG: hypothetical protein U5L06_05275 [Rhodovibrio sp.]|nr:hypothetical protein [Rhodovibrio sp.]
MAEFFPLATNQAVLRLHHSAKQHQIDVVADVVPLPLVSFTFINRETLASVLRDLGIKYVFFGKELGTT